MIAVALSVAWFSPAEAAEQGIAIDKVASLQPIWSTALKGATRATPVSDGQSLYIPNGNGYLYRIDEQDRAGCLGNRTRQGARYRRRGGVPGADRH